MDRLKLVENYLGRELTTSKRILKRYEVNSRRSGRHFSYYSRFIEPFIIDTLINFEGGNWNFYWRKSSFLNKVHFFYVLLLPASIFITLAYLFIEEELIEQYQFALPLIILAILGISTYLIIINVMAYSFIIWAFQLRDIEFPVMNKNVAALTSITLSRKFYLGSAVIMGVSGYLITSISKIGAFKGLGGGKFGGGGASGKW